MYNNPYMQSQYNSQANLDRINAQMNELEKIKQQITQQMQQPVPNVTQNFQIAPTNRDVIKYANSLEEVQRDMVVGETPYFSKDLSVVWIKSTNGNIKTYELSEIIPKDTKDLQIEYLQAQIDELKKGKIENDAIYSNVNAKQVTTDTEINDKPIGKAIEDEQPISVQKISASKRKQ